MLAAMPILAPLPSSTILFEGDSLSGFRSAPLLDSWAWIRLTGATHGFPERVGEWVFCHRPDLRLSVRNGAIGGSTIADLLERFDRHVVPVKPGIIVLTVGTNDCGQGVPLEKFSADLREYARRLHELCGGRLLHVGGFKPMPGAGPDSAHALPTMPAYMGAAAATVTAAGGLAVDAGSVLAHKATELVAQYSGHSIFHDGTHFGPVGHEILAGVVLRALGLIELPGDPTAAG